MLVDNRLTVISPPLHDELNELSSTILSLSLPLSLSLSLSLSPRAFSVIDFISRPVRPRPSPPSRRRPSVRSLAAFNHRRTNIHLESFPVVDVVGGGDDVGAVRFPFVILSLPSLVRSPSPATFIRWHVARPLIWTTATA